MTLHFRRVPIWILLNLIGMATYLRLGSDLWTLPGLRHMEEFSPIESEAKRGQSRHAKKYLA